MAEELEIPGDKINPLAAAAKKLADGEGQTSTERQEKKIEITEQSTESTTNKTEEDAKRNGLQSETHSQNQEKEKDGDDEKEKDGDKSPEQIIQQRVLELEKLPENEGKSEEDLRTIIKENAERSLHTEKEETNPDKPVVNLNDEIKRETNGQFESLEDIIEATKKPELTFANDQIKHLNKLVLEGVDIDKVLAFNSLKIDDLDPTNIEDAKKLTRLGLQNDEPDITDKDIDYELKQQYDLTEKLDEMDEVTNKDAIAYAISKLSRNAKKVKDTLLNKQKELELPPPGQNNQTEADKELAGKQFQEWQTKVDSSLESYETLEIPLGNDQSFNFKIEGEVKESLKKTMTNTNDFFNRYVVDGKADMEKFRQDMTILENWRTISPALVAQGDSVGSKRVFDSIQNPSSKDKDGVGEHKSGQVKSPKGQIADAMIKEGHI